MGVSAPSGFTPLGRVVGRKYKTNASTAIGVGDVVELTSDGLVATVTAGSVHVIGVAMEPCLVADAGKYILVCDDPMMEYAVQGDVTASAVTQIGLNAPITYTTLNTLTGVSRQSVAIASAATTADLPVRIIGIEENPSSTVGGTYATYRVQLNKTQQVQPSGNLGV